MELKQISLEIGPDMQKYLDAMKLAEKNLYKHLMLPKECFGKKDSKTLGSEGLWLY